MKTRKQEILDAAIFTAKRIQDDADILKSLLASSASQAMVKDACGGIGLLAMTVQAIAEKDGQ